MQKKKKLEDLFENSAQNLKIIGFPPSGGRAYLSKKICPNYRELVLGCKH